MSLICVGITFLLSIFPFNLLKIVSFFFFWFALFSVYLRIYLQTLWRKSQLPWYAETRHQFASYMCFMNNSLLWTVALQAAALLFLLFSFPITLRIPFTSLLYCILFSVSGLLFWCIPSLCWRMSSLASSVRMRRRKAFGEVWRCLYHTLTFIWWLGWM